MRALTASYSTRFLSIYSPRLRLMTYRFNPISKNSRAARHFLCEGRNEDEVSSTHPFSEFAYHGSRPILWPEPWQLQ